MRVLTLVSAPRSLDDVARLSAEIRTFNREIDFRLRFLDIEIEEAFVAPPEVRAALEARVGRTKAHEVSAKDGLLAAARLALVVAEERPNLLVVVGSGDLVPAGVAAAKAAGCKLAFFGGDRARADGAVDLGDDAAGAVDRMTGLAREIS